MEVSRVDFKKWMRQVREIFSRFHLPQLKTPAAKAVYVAAVATIFTFLGCWAVLAYQDAPAPTVRSMGDEKFAIEAAQGGIAEVKLGELAQEKAQNEAVRKFGQRMVEEHTKANHRLKEAALKEKISLPKEMDKKDQATYHALAKLSGAEFDKAYVRDMVQDHQDDIAEFGTEARTGQREEIKTFAAETLPTLKEHLKAAKDMRVAIMKPAVTSDSKTPNKATAKQSGTR
jgi:putative membrane protein